MNKKVAPSKPLRRILTLIALASLSLGMGTAFFFLLKLRSDASHEKELAWKTPTPRADSSPAGLLENKRLIDKTQMPTDTTNESRPSLQSEKGSGPTVKSLEPLTPTEEIVLALAGEVELEGATPESFAQRLVLAGLRPTSELQGNSGERRKVFVHATDMARGIETIGASFLKEPDGTDHFLRYDSRLVGDSARFARLRGAMASYGEAGWENYVSREGIESWVHPKGWKRWIELNTEPSGEDSKGTSPVSESTSTPRSSRETIVIALEERLE